MSFSRLPPGGTLPGPDTLPAAFNDPKTLAATGAAGCSPDGIRSSSGASFATNWWYEAYCCFIAPSFPRQTMSWNLTTLPVSRFFHVLVTCSSRDFGVGELSSMLTSFLCLPAIHFDPKIWSTRWPTLTSYCGSLASFSVLFVEEVLTRSAALACSQLFGMGLGGEVGPFGFALVCQYAISFAPDGALAGAVFVPPDLLCHSWMDV